MYFSPQKQKFIDAAIEMFGDGVVLDKQGVRDASAKQEFHLLVGS